MSSVYTIDPGTPFLDALVRGLAERYGNLEGEHLRGALILVPTRRAARALTEAFRHDAEARGRKAVLLPRLRAIGDVDEDEILLDGLVRAATEAGSPAPFELPPAIPSLRREILLASLVRRWRGTLAIAGPSSLDATPGRALALARELARFLDLVLTEGADLGRLAELVPEHFAGHWQHTLEFLKIVSESWPTVLAEERAIDPSTRRDLLLRALAERWRDQPPGHPIIAAGSTGSIPATAELLSVIAGLPKGAVILPGLDLALDRKSWEEVGPGHPQAAMKQLLERLNVLRTEVARWAAGLSEASHAARIRLVNEALRPVNTTDAWRDIRREIDLVAATNGLALIEADGPAHEALSIALALREALEVPGRTAALVTPDRDLARRVVTELARFDLEIDDSAGLRLARTPPAVFLRLVAHVAASLAPVPLLSLLRHPLCGAGLARGSLSRAASLLERRLLRGLRSAPGLDGLRRALRSHTELSRSEEGMLTDLLNRIERALSPLTDSLARHESEPGAILTAHIRAAECLADSREDGQRIAGVKRLWRGEDGEALAELLNQALSELARLGTVPCSTYAELFDSLLEPHVVYKPARSHPRLHIWGPLEARLQQADLVILGGLNEGTWPATAELDPWLNRPMRQALGLPLPEERLGLAAHDFSQLASAREVILTRAAKTEGTKTIASRWLLRLRNLLKGAGAEHLLVGKLPHGAWASGFDTPPERKVLDKPRPKPPPEARPRKLSVSAIGTLNRDPYAVYARHVLKLDPLDPLDAEPDGADRGILIHEILAAYGRTWPDELPPDVEDRLIVIARSMFEAQGPDNPAMRAIWWPRFRTMARWFVSLDRELRTRQRIAAVELRGELVLDAPLGPFHLTARADRVDMSATGSFSLYDYKTGRAPTEKEAAAGLEPQLPLEAAMLMAGAFEGLAPGPVTELAYIALSGHGDGGLMKPLGKRKSIEDLASHARAGLEALIAHYDNPATPYLSRVAPRSARLPGDYDYLARVREWSAIGEMDE